MHEYVFGIEENIYSEDEVEFKELYKHENLSMLEALEEIKKFIKKNPECYFDNFPMGERVVQVSTEDEKYTAWVEEE